MIDPQFVHQMEQATAALVQLAHHLGKYRESLLASGFSRQESLHLVLQYQRSLTDRNIHKSITEDHVRAAFFAGIDCGRESDTMTGEMLEARLKELLP